jgi:hypothetical protein
MAAENRLLVINPLIFAEVSAGYERVEELEEALPPELFRRENLPWEAAFLAGECFLLLGLPSRWSNGRWVGAAVRRDGPPRQTRPTCRWVSPLMIG